MVKKIIKILLTFVVVLSIYLSLSLSPVLFKNLSNKTSIHEDNIIVAHRGASKLAPENTIASINSALKLNVDCIEIDVHQTLDSIVILMHDSSLERTTNGKGLIKDITYAEISKLDAGEWFSQDFKNEKVPTLENVIKRINGKCQLIIEIKKGNSYYPNIEKNVLKTIKKYNAEKWIIIHSFSTEILKSVHSINPNIKLHKLFLGKFKFVPLTLSNKIEIFDFENLPFIDTYSLNYVFANKETITLLKSKGKKINAWTVDSPKIAKELISMGVDGIITNNPDIINK